MLETNVTLPSKPRVVSEESFTGTYEIDGLYPGYGHTLGNSLRRIILSSPPSLFDAVMTESSMSFLQSMASRRMFSPFSLISSAYEWQCILRNPLQ